LASYKYDERGDLVELTDSYNITRSFEYEGHLMTRLTNHNSKLGFYWEYEGTGNSARSIHAWGDGGVTEYRFQYEPGVTKVRNRLGTTREYYYNEKS
jgi:hypothetical protein